MFIGRREKTDSGEGEAFWLVRDRMISGQHASIARAGSGFELTDLGSTNGTIVTAWSPSPSPLRDGALIFIGGHVPCSAGVGDRSTPSRDLGIRAPDGADGIPLLPCMPAKLRKWRIRQRGSAQPARTRG